MAIKANASAQGGSDYKKYVGVASFQVKGVNASKEELEQFFGRELQSEPEYLKDRVDANDGDKPYKQLRVSFMIEANTPENIDAKEIEARKTNANLTAPLRTTINFFIDSRYFFNRDKTKVQVIDKYGRTAWVTVEQAKNHQIPVYKNGPARLDADYRPAYRGEEALTQFILNYLNVTPIESYNKNTGEWMKNAHPEDCEGNLYKIKDYFKGDISELVGLCKLMPNNFVKLCMGVRTDGDGNQFNTVYTHLALRNGSKSYTFIKDDIEGQQITDTVFTNDPAGNITAIEEYKENVTETDFSADDPFANDTNDLPFSEAEDDADPFAA